MAMTHRQRVSIYSTLVEVMGQEDAEALMEQLPPFDWDQIATKDDLKASELRILAELAKTNAALLETNAALVRTNGELAATRADFKEALAETNGELAQSSASLRGALAELRGETQLGFARLERRLAWYLVVVAALLVGFGIAVWIPLMSALSDTTSSARLAPVPAEAPPALAEPEGPPS